MNELVRGCKVLQKNVPASHSEELTVRRLEKNEGGKNQRVCATLQCWMLNKGKPNAKTRASSLYLSPRPY